MKKVVILGGHGDGIVVAQGIEDLIKYGVKIQLVGFLNDCYPEEKRIFTYPVLGKLEDWKNLDEGLFFITALHKVKLMPERAEIIKKLKIPISRWTNVFHPTSCISRDVQLGAGIFIASCVTIQPGAKVGSHSTIRAGANLGHDTSIDDFCYVGPNATLCGRSSLEEGAHLGPNAVITDGKRVGKYSVVGIGSGVTKNLEPYSIYHGNPAHKIGSIKNVIK
jgi:acetyltransferase EpsM